MKLDKPVISRLESRLGRTLDNPAACETLSAEIFKATGDLLSANTLKRLVGLIPYQSSPRLQTLDIVARYLGASCWRQLIMDIDDEVSCFGHDEGIDADRLPVGARVELSWSPNRRVVLRLDNDGFFFVEQAEHSKLRVGDRLRASRFVEGFPLLARDVTRDGKIIGDYTAAKEFGLDKVSERVNE